MILNSKSTMLRKMNAPRDLRKQINVTVSLHLKKKKGTTQHFGALKTQLRLEFLKNSPLLHVTTLSGTNL